MDTNRMNPLTGLRSDMQKQLQMKGTPTCGGKNLSVGDGRPAAVVLLSWRRLVRRMSEESSDAELVLSVSEDAGVPAVVPLCPQGGPADMDALCAVPSDLTLQLVCLHPFNGPLQVQFGN